MVEKKLEKKNIAHFNIIIILCMDVLNTFGGTRIRAKQRTRSRSDTHKNI